MSFGAPPSTAHSTDARTGALPDFTDSRLRAKSRAKHSAQQKARMDAIETARPADAAKTVIDEIDGFAVRFCKGPRADLSWQAGLIRAEYRDYRDPGMESPFQGRVTLFYLLGHGATQLDALSMARHNWDNGGVR